MPKPTWYEKGPLKTTAVIEERPPGSGLWWAVCNCGDVLVEKGTYEQASDAFGPHRPGPWPT
jgi:hypothetical protein